MILVDDSNGTLDS